MLYYKPTLVTAMVASIMGLVAATDNSPACHDIKARDSDHHLAQDTKTTITTTFTNVAVLTLGSDALPSATYTDTDTSETSATVLVTCGTSTKTMTSSHYNATAHSVTPTSSSSTLPLTPVATTTPHGPCNCTAEGSGFSTVITTSTLPGTLTRTNATVSVNGTLYPTGGAGTASFTTTSATHTHGYPTTGSSSAAASATEATQNAASPLVAAVVGKLLGAVAVGMIVVA